MKTGDKIIAFFNKSLLELSLQIGYKSNALSVWACNSKVRCKKIERWLLEHHFVEDERLMCQIGQIKEEHRQIKQILKELGE